MDYEPKDYTPRWFEKWRSNEFWHLDQRVKFNSRLLWIILAALVAATLIDRLV